MRYWLTKVDGTHAVLMPGVGDAISIQRGSRADLSAAARLYLREVEPRKRQAVFSLTVARAAGTVTVRNLTMNYGDYIEVGG